MDTSDGGRWTDGVAAFGIVLALFVGAPVLTVLMGKVILLAVRGQL